MRASAVTSFLNALGAALMSGDTGSVAARFLTPTPVYLGDQLMVLGSRDIANDAMQIMAAGFQEHGVRMMQARVAAVELPRGPMQKVWVDWDYRGLGGALIATVRTEYVLRDPETPDSTMIEIVNYVDFAFPDLVRRLPLAR